MLHGKIILVVAYDEKIISTIKLIYHLPDHRTLEEAGQGLTFQPGATA